MLTDLKDKENFTDEDRKRISNEIGEILEDTNRKIHQAIKDNDLDFFNRFFGDTNNKKALFRFIESDEFNEDERECMRKILKEMGKL